MKVTKILSVFLAAVLLSSTYRIPVSKAAVIEPEIVKTETWTTSYYIDDDESTTYPYIDCQADIYSDGTVKCYFWNTHEWDGFATVKHLITIVNSEPYPNDSRWYAFCRGEEFNYLNKLYKPLTTDHSAPHEYTKPYIADYSYFEKHDLSFYPKEYKYTHNQWTYNEMWCNDQNNDSIFMFAEYPEYAGSIDYFTWNDALSKMNNNKTELVFSPTIDPIETYQFHILGHDITVSPDILSSHIVATPQVSEQEKKIEELEKENLKLKEEIAKLKADPSVLQDDISRLDANGDGAVNAVDASIVLTIYAYNSTNNTKIKSFSDYNAIFNK